VSSGQKHSNESRKMTLGILPQDSVFIAIPAYQHRGVVRGQEKDIQRNTCRQSQLGSQLPARSPYSWTGFTNFTIIM
jgi:hypothetical protein